MLESGRSWCSENVIRCSLEPAHFSSVEGNIQVPRWKKRFIGSSYYLHHITDRKWNTILMHGSVPQSLIWGFLLQYRRGRGYLLMPLGYPTLLTYWSIVAMYITVLSLYNGFCSSNIRVLVPENHLFVRYTHFSCRLFLVDWLVDRTLHCRQSHYLPWLFVLSSCRGVSYYLQYIEIKI